MDIEVNFGFGVDMSLVGLGLGDVATLLYCGLSNNTHFPCILTNATIYPGFQAVVKLIL